MLLRLCAISAVVYVVTLVGGCACPCAKCGIPRTPCAPCIYEQCECHQIPPDLASAIFADATPVPLPAPDETYDLLTATDCQCYAATNTSIANMVELERHWAQVVIQCDTERVDENLCLDRDLLSLHASSMRNESAGAALTAFYQLAGLEAQHYYLQHALSEAEKTLQRIDELRKSGIGLPEGVDRTTVAGQIGTIRDELTQMEFARLQLNGQLQKLVGCPINEQKFFWPEMDWMVDLNPVDVELELAVGLENRHDLRGLELVLCNLEKVSLPVARGVLKFADSAVGTVEPRDGLIHVLRCYRCNEHEVPVRCRQLSIFYDDTEDKGTAEIKSAAYKIGLQQHRVLIAQQRVQELRTKLDELGKMRDVDNVAIFKISSLRGELDRAEATLVEQVVATKLAQVELKLAQGLLATECGFAPQLCLEGCCHGACMRCGKK